ncbi:hypothetical protein ND861_07065 [Leptospira sp. 2 VSF19]|uniref:Uncharacterized protein n=1 Tax=Leptospira soteropolitanensis TaxID=2950025 RepID=A0AAW5VDV5_9LEPT|nr:hypothetical protein [Leptospira soteropolitanensis]MCW7494648.1 hypothetical protein [Leptospira soteropolitanensis]MCW7499990.1 hypothetical protein [Leptospira soteropolitanensis]MCW7522241.1 hypothetical protein [Leptospira soteropolitanensis]MCW7526097.1 hypothetical protein [Leptospira soteropolitanensis]MCW7529791.1 hypothetical protein [Leptospira soteropolitanensis]
MSLENEVLKNQEVQNQMKAGNSIEQIMLGDYPKALTEAIMNTMNSNKDISAKLLNDERFLNKFAKIMLNIFIQNLNNGMT